MRLRASQSFLARKTRNTPENAPSVLNSNRDIVLGTIASIRGWPKDHHTQ